MIFKRVAAYTLIECLSVLCVLMILLTLSAASYHYIVAQNKRAIYLNKVISSLRIARATALASRTVVTICPSLDGRQCGGHWRDGWLIYRNGALHPAAQTLTIIYVQAALPRGDALFWRAALSKDQRVQFTSLGNALQNGTFVYCPHHEQRLAGAVILSLTGRSRVADENFAQTICAEDY